MKNKVNVLGTIYTIKRRKYKEDPFFEKGECSAYCFDALNLIVIGILDTWDGAQHTDEDKRGSVIAEKENLRHEIVHAFFNESGLAWSSTNLNKAWAKNEEMVDWIARQGTKLYKAWQDAGAI